MAANQIQAYADMVNLQMASEAFLNGRLTPASIRDALVVGNRNSSRAPDAVADLFVPDGTNGARYKLIAHQDLTLNASQTIPGVNAKSGFSASLFLDTKNNQYTFSIRSTEFADSIKDLGDTKADGVEIFDRGWAFAQINSMEVFWQYLQSGTPVNGVNGITTPSAADLVQFRTSLSGGGKVNVTGYSLGGNLATAFVELHRDQLNAAYLFNSAGTGNALIQGGFGAVWTQYKSVFDNPFIQYPATGPAIYDDNNVTVALGRYRSNPTVTYTSLYDDPRHILAQYAIRNLVEGAFSASENVIGGGPSGAPRTPDLQIFDIWASNYRGDSGVDTVTARSGQRHGTSRPVWYENQPVALWQSIGTEQWDWGTGHSLVLLQDSLNLMAALEKLDGTVTEDQVALFFQSASDKSYDSLEKALDGLSRLFGFGVPVTSATQDGAFANLALRNSFYQQLKDIQGFSGYQSLLGKVKVEVLPPASALALATSAKEDFGALASLIALSPIRLVANDAAARTLLDNHWNSVFNSEYAQWQADQSLSAADRAAGRGNFTESFLVDRSSMLSFLLAGNTNDTSAFASNQVNDQRLYSDLARSSGGRPTEINVFLPGGTPNPRGPNTRIIGFGTNSTDVLQGRDNHDRLYGGGGKDVLVGGAGNDYLEGGAGVDAYQFNAGQGKDTIFDTDGKGQLLRNGKALALGIKQSDNVWTLGGTTYTKDGADLVVTFADNAEDKVTVRNFDFAAGQANGYLGIRLFDVPADPAATNHIYGDLEPIDFNPPNLSYQTDALGNVIVNPDAPAPNRVDTLLDSTGSDYIDAGGGNDLIAATRGGGDWVLGGAGRDRIQTAGGNDIIEGGTGDDIAQGGAGNDRIYGRDNVTVDAAITAGETAGTVGGTSELLSGDGGDDIVAGSNTSDLLLGGDGKDIIVGGGGDDNILGDASLVAADLTWTATRSTSTDPNGGTVRVITFSANTFIATSDTVGAADVIYGGAGDDWVFAGAGDDYIEGGSGKDVLFGEAGSDALVGGADDDVLLGDSPNVDAAGLSGDDYLDGGAGADQLFGGKGSDVLIGSEGNDSLSGGDGDDLLDGGAGVDQLFGGNGNDILIGGAGDDELFGGTGNDVLNGGAGQDILQGEAGKDTYVFNAGDVVGNEFINDTIDTANSAEASVLVLNGYTRNQIKFRTGSLMVDLGDGGAIHFSGFAAGDPLATPVLDSIQFADGTSMSYQDVLDQGFDLDGTELGEFHFGTAVTDRIDGKGGDDTILGNSGDDVLTGGTGDDQLFGQSGKDTYVFNRGDGQDLVEDAPEVEDFSDASVLRFGEGIAREDLIFRVDESRNLVVDAGQGDTVTFKSFNASDPASNPIVESIQFAGGTSMSYAEILAQGFDLEGTEDGDYIRGTGVTDRVEGMDGNDTLTTESGDDVLHGEAGDDVLIAGDGDDLLEGGAGSDALNGEDGDDILDGGEDDDVLNAGEGDDLLDGGAGDDALYGGAGNDTLIGGEGSNGLDGGAGDDLIVAGDGDTVVDTLGENHLDVTAYTTLNASNLEITQYQADGGDLFLNLHVRNAAHPGETPATGGVSFVGGLESFAAVTLNDGAGGTVTLSGNQLRAYIAGGLVMRGTDGADAMAGTEADDTIELLAGADAVDAGAGDDQIDGGTGDDTLIGGTGDDTYLLSFNGGRDTVIEDAEPGSMNTVRLDSGITAGMLRAARIGDDLRIQVKATGDALLVKDFYTHSESWQDDWSVVDGFGNSAGITALSQTVIPTAAEWLAAQKADFRDRREQVFVSARIGDRLAPGEDGRYQRVDRGFSYEAGQATSTRTVSWMTEPNTIYADGSNQNIEAGNSVVTSTFITQSVQLVSQSVLQSTGQGRSTPQKNLGIAGGGGGQNPYFIPVSQGFNGLSIQQGSGITYTAVYGPYIGIAPRNALGQIDPNAMELKGWWVYNGPAPTESSSPLTQRLIQNVVQTVALATTNDTRLTVTDVAVSGSDLPFNIVAQNSVVESGSGDDNIELTATTDLVISNNISDSPSLNSFRLPTWQSDMSLPIDTHSPSAAQWRFRNLRRPGGAPLGVRYGDMSLAGLRTLGGFVDAGAGADQVTGSDGDDVIAGSDGDDVIDGGYGADTYLYAADESGIDLLMDFGYVDAPAYGDWYYWNRGILNWDERLEHGGQYRHGGNEANEGVSYWDAPEDAWEHFYVGTPLDYIEPLAETPPPLTRNDTAALSEMMHAGVLPRDVVRFGPGLSLSDLELSVSVDPAGLDDHPEQPWYYGGTLSVRWGNAGFDTYIPQVEFGDLLDNDETLLGEGIEAFEFADGTSYTLEQVLNAAKLVIQGTPDDDEIVGGARNELLDGGEGHDTLDGGAGNDILRGGSGSDTYRFGLGNGGDTVTDDDGGLGGTDTVQFGAGIAPEDVSLSRQGANLVVHIDGSADVLTVKGQFSGASAIELFMFADETTWGGGDIYQQFEEDNYAPVLFHALDDSVAVVGMQLSLALPAGAFFDADPGETLQYSATLGDGSDLPGWLSISPISGRLSGTPGAGDAGALDIRITAADPFGAYATDDIVLNVVQAIVGTDDDEYLEGTESADYIVGRGGSDQVFALGGDDVIFGGTGSDQLIAGGGNDTIHGGTGEFDDLSGGDGDDTYVYARGDGIDSVFDEAGDDTVQFGAGIAPSEIVVTQNPYGTVYLQVGGPLNRVDLINWFSEENRIEHVRFADGTAWDAAAIEARIATAPATVFSDILNLSDGNDVIDGLAGHDWIIGNGGNDALFGGAGDDELIGGAGVNLLAGGSGYDVLNAYDGTAALVLFNAGDGEDYLDTNGSVVLSLGGVTLADITLEWYSESYLRLGMGGADGMILYGYVEDPQVWPSGKLQLVGSDISTYDLNAVVQAFYDARAQSPEITQWSAASALQDNLLSVSTTEAFGGAIAYQYATTGGVGGLTSTQQQSVLGDAEFGVAPQLVALAPSNHAPTALALSADTVAENAPGAAVGTLSTTDEDAGDTFTYSILSGDDGAQFAIAGNELRVGSTGLDYEADAVRTVNIRSTDAAGAYFDRAFSINVTDVQEGNSAPVVSASNGAVIVGQAVAASSLFSVADAENNPITQYEFWDSTSGNGHFTVNGVEQGVNVSISVPSSSIQDTFFASGSAIGNDLVWVRANDGQAWSEWKAWNMISALHIPNAAPEVAAANATILLGEAVSATSLFSATDADQDPVTQYEFWDSTAGGGHFTVNGVQAGVDVSIAVSAADLANTQFVGASSAGDDLVWVRASDGQDWSDWKSWTMSSWPHLVNSAPVVTAGGSTLIVSEVASAASLFTVADGDNDAIARYEFWDDVNGGGYWRVNGAQQGAAQTIAVSAADLANTAYVAGASGGTEQVWVRASDGLEWGAWKAWNITTALHVPNAAPVVTASNSTVLLNSAVDASSLFSVADADNDTITQYEFWDSTSGAGHFTVNGIEQGVNVSISVASSSLENTSFVGGSANSLDQVWVRANDGQAWSDWKSWYVTSAPHLTNATPVVAASTYGLLRSEAVSAAGLFSVSDGDGDTVTRYQFWDDVNGGGHFELGGVQQAAGQNIDVSAAQLASVTYVGGANAGTEQVWVRANDGIAWGAWENWFMSTEGGMLRGGVEPDTLNGDPATPILEGGAGDDTLNGGDPDGLLSGGEGEDAVNGGAGNDLLAGGAGNDTISTGGGSNVVVFNAGDGADAVYSASGASNTLSLGNGLSYDDLSLSRDGDDLVLNAGGDDSVRLKDWYNGKDTIENLQLILDASGDYDANSSDLLYNHKVQSFDFRGMVSQFDQALAQSPGLNSWALTNALLQHHLSGADDAAVGGDLAYWYGKNNGFTGIGLASAQQVIGAAGFGSDAQSLHTFSGIQEGLVKLS